MKRARLVLLSLATVLSLAAGIAVACPMLLVSITAPAGGQHFTGDRTIAVTGTVRSSSWWWRPYVAVRVNGGPATYAPVYRGSFRVPVTLADGQNLIQATVRAGPLYGRASRSVSYEQATQAPFEVAVTSPAAGASLTGSRAQAVRGTVGGRAGAVVAVSVNGAAPVAAAVAGGEFSATIELAEGDNAIVATATAGAESVSSTVRVTYQALPPPAIAIEWPPEGEVVFGSRTVLVRGTVANVTSPSVLVAVNGGDPVSATVVGDGTFSAQVQLADRASAIVASVLAPEGAAADTTHVFYPFLTLETFQVAERVIGQPGPTIAAPEPCDPITASDVCNPYGSAGWNGAALFLSDSARNRVLVFDGIPAIDGAPARFALGQPDLASGAPSSAAGGLAEPETIRIADGKLFVAEYANNRILIFDDVPQDFGAEASVAVGAASVDIPGSGECAGDTLLRPESFVVVGSRLIVADRGHNRVLVWNQIPTVSGTPADVVLGQPSFTSCDPNHGERSERSLFWPTDVWTDGTRLLIADTRNHRVLGWNSFPSESFAPADFVLGQASFTLAELASTRAGLREPVALTSNGNQLFVVDQLNGRVLVWNTFPSSSGVLPDVVLGQGDFELAAHNDDDQDGSPDALPTGRTLFLPAGVTATEEALVVTDSGNSRYLVFRGR
ncbi:MAG TPA: hypothetical protein VEB43_00025 [Anaeromyxobacter sp.]|nr:hypothetical protein [Anaeromyxobacter sp.]